MEVISKEILESIDSWDYETPQQLIMDIIDKCKELPAQQWQTIDEFRANPVEGWCHISFGKEHNVDMAYYEYNKFWCNDMHDKDQDYIFEDYIVTNVMPIKTPEAPK